MQALSCEVNMWELRIEIVAGFSLFIGAQAPATQTNVPVC